MVRLSIQYLTGLKVHEREPMPNTTWVANCLILERVGT